MNGYLLSVIGTVILSALLTAIIPEGKTAGLIRAIARLACVLAIVAPVLNFFKSGSLTLGDEKISQTIFSQSVIEADEAFIKYYSEMRVRETEKALEAEISDKYAVQADVSLEWELQSETVDGKYTSEEIRIRKIVVRTDKQSEEEVLKKMWEYLTKNYCSEVLIE